MDIFANIQSDQLKPTTDRNLAASIFKRAIRSIEIEVFSYCNRRCWFCPNSYIDRMSKNNVMPTALYSTILDQLASIHYDKIISYSRYNEPLSSKIILDRIREAREKLPNALLHTNTNGDYLDSDYIAHLYDAGLRSLNIQAYLANNETYSHIKISKRINQMIHKLGLVATLVRDIPGEWLEYSLRFEDMNIRLYGRNFEINGTNRGGTINIRTNEERISPCLVPYSFIYIDFNGKIVPCCNIRSDVPEHASYITADISVVSDIFLAYTNRHATNFRKYLLTEEVKGGACAGCTFSTFVMTPERRSIINLLIKSCTEDPSSA